jgi:putative endopeptidase
LLRGRSNLTLGLLDGYAPYLPAAYVNAEFNFSGQVIGGREVNLPRWKRGVSTVEAALGEPVGRLYIDKYFKADAKARMDALIKNLLAAFKAGIDELEWMSPATRTQAQAKLAKYTLKIASPDRWRDYSGLEARSDDLVGNVMRSREFQHADLWERLGTPVQRWRWGFTPQTVNASYNSSNNEITFPAGILQPPFFNVDADDAVN